MPDAEPENEKELSVVQEACAIWDMAWKVSLATFCRIGTFTIGTAFVGHLGKNELAAASLAGIWTNGAQVLVFGFAVSLCTVHTYNNITTLFIVVMQSILALWSSLWSQKL